MDPDNDTREKIMKAIRLWNTLRCIYFTFLIIMAADVMMLSYWQWSKHEWYHSIAISDTLASLIFYLFTICVDLYLFQMGCSVLDLIKN